jgi:hypothetical protein
MEPDRWPGPGRRSAPGPRRSTRAVLPAVRHRCDQRIDYVFFRSAMRISWSTLTLLFSRETRRRRQPELGALAAGTAEQTPAGGDRTGAGSRRLNLVLVSRPPVWLSPGRGPLCRPGRPARCRHGAWPFARVSGRAVHPTKPCPAATAAAAATAPNPTRTVAHRHRPGPHRSERAAGSLTPASSSAHCTPMTAPA